MILIPFMLDFWLGILNLEKNKELKNGLSEELMPVAWHPNRWWDWWEKRNRSNVYWRVVKVYVDSI